MKNDKNQSLLQWILRLKVKTVCKWERERARARTHVCTSTSCSLCCIFYHRKKETGNFDVQYWLIGRWNRKAGYLPIGHGILKCFHFIIISRLGWQSYEGRINKWINLSIYLFIWPLHSQDWSRRRLLEVKGKGSGVVLLLVLGLIEHKTLEG